MVARMRVMSIDNKVVNGQMSTVCRTKYRPFDFIKYKVKVMFRYLRTYVFLRSHYHCIYSNMPISRYNHINIYLSSFNMIYLNVNVIKYISCSVTL